MVLRAICNSTVDTLGTVWMKLGKIFNSIRMEREELLKYFPESLLQLRSELMNMFFHRINMDL